MACAVTAALGAVSVARAPAGGASVPVVVAARTLGTGAELTPAVLRLARWPVAFVPEGALTTVAAATGRRLAAPLTSGEVVTGSRVSGSGVLAGQPTGTRAVHVSVGDPGAIAMVQPGDLVDLVGPDGVVAASVPVLTLDSDARGAQSQGLVGAAPLGGSTSGSDGLVVGVDETAAEAMARLPADAMGRPPLTLVLRSG
jgi:Flp pilus assembly protein CpaB